MTESNPIQQRIEMLADKWKEASGTPGVLLVRILYGREETEMIDTFFKYMLGMEDCVIDDIPFVYDLFCLDADSYSKELLETTDKNIHIWNQSQKSKNIAFEPIDWQANYHLAKETKNKAALFSANFNRLVNTLEMDDGIKAVAVFAPALKVNKAFNVWLQDLLRCSARKQTQYLVADSKENPTLNDLQYKFPHLVKTVEANMDMSKTMEQVAAMGSPDEPSTAFRIAFIKMMNAMQARQEAEMYKQANNCLTLVWQYAAADSYWYTQSIVIYCALSNYQLGQKRYDHAIAEIDKAIKVAAALLQRMPDPAIAHQYLAQTYMQKGTVYYADKDWSQAAECYKTAAAGYKQGQQYILFVEASRMHGIVARKAGDTGAALEAWAEGARAGAHIPKQTIIGTSHAALLEELLSVNYSKVISNEELEQIAVPLYGENWRHEVANWKKIPEKYATQPQEEEF